MSEASTSEIGHVWSDAEIITLSALQHIAYCPRQCALIHVEQVWDENLYTLRGRRLHEHVDETVTETRDGVRMEHALPLFSDRLGLIGRADVVEFGPDGTPFPVEHKAGKRGKGARARRADEIQLCAQALCLEDMVGVPVSRGALSYRGSGKRQEVIFTDDLRSEVVDLTRRVRQLLARLDLPAPAADERCRHCSLIDACMPFVGTTMDDESDPDQ